MPSFLLRSFLGLAVCAAATVSSAWAGSFNAIYAFGDSLSDAGNAFIATGGAQPAPPYFNGHFTNGQVWVQDLAADLGLPALAPSLAGGTDFAVGGAESGTTPVHAANASDLSAQLVAFHAANLGGANPNGLYTIWIGSNDLNAILGSNPTALQAQADVAAVITNVDNAITVLAGQGAKNFLIVTVPDLGKTPAAIASGPLGVAAASNIAALFDTSLVSTFGGLAAADGVNLKVLDSYSLIDGIVANPGAYGLTDVTDQCLVGAVNYAGGTACANPSQYLFWDQLHPTAAGQLLTANAALAVVTPEPGTMLTMVVGSVGILAVVVRRRRGVVVKAEEV